MDPLSISASIVALASVVRETVRLVKGVNEGYNERVRLAIEVKSLLVTLRSTEGYFETIEDDVTAPWMPALQNLTGDGGALQQAHIALERLNKKLQPKTGRSKVVQSLAWPLMEKSDVSDTMQHVMRLNQSMSAVLQQANISMTQGIRADTTDLHDALHSSHLNAVADWLSPLDMLAKQASLTQQRGEGTGGWLIKSNSLQFWLQNTRQLMWCPGIPGAGKTFLSSIIVQYLKDFAEDRDIGVFMLYCSFNDPHTQSVDALLSDLLKQAIQVKNEVFHTLRKLYQAHSKSHTRLSREELVSEIEFAFSDYSKVYLVVDGLDEILQEHARLTLIEALWNVKGNVNLMITSRPLPTVEQHFCVPGVICDICHVPDLKSYYHCLECPDWDCCMSCHALGKAICFQGHRHVRQFKASRVEIKAAAEDLQSYVRMRISSSPALISILGKKPAMQQDIVDAVTRVAADRFLLAKFHMDTLVDLHRPSQIVQALKELPVRIDETYDQAMQRIDDMQPHREEAMAVLKWVVCALRPLTVREIEHATTICPGQRDFDADDIIPADVLCSWCAGLLTIEAGFVGLVHYTAEDYFSTKGGQWFPEAFSSMGRACLSYLSMDAIQLTPSTIQDDPLGLPRVINEAAAMYEYEKQFALLKYAGSYWMHYVKYGRDAEFDSVAIELLLDTKKVAIMAMIFRCVGFSNAVAREYEYNRCELLYGASALHIASFVGLERIVSKLLKEGMDLSSEDSAGLNPLIYASLQGCNGVVKILLEAGADPNFRCLQNSTALHRAVFHGRGDVVETLLHCKNIDINLREKTGGLTPLSSAILQGQLGLVNRLLAREDVLLNEDGPALILAAYTGHTEIVKALLEHPETQLELRDDYGRTALLNAIRGNVNIEVVGVLLDAGANIDITDTHGSTPLLEAVHRGYSSIRDEIIHRRPELTSVSHIPQDKVVCVQGEYRPPNTRIRMIENGKLGPFFN